MQEKTVTWVVYLKTIHKRPDRMTAVCEQSEWDGMELARPGYHQLIRSGITTEVEAEKLARGHAAALLPIKVTDKTSPTVRLEFSFTNKEK